MLDFLILDDEIISICYNLYMENESTSLLETQQDAPKVETPSSSPSRVWIFILFAAIIIGLIGTAVFFLSRSDLETTSRIRDIFIIFMA
ncbi:MAG: hypothetical protein CVU45_05730, partial [Chloroflexi bacterium HGW-Chloroflexi-7]